MIQTVIKLQAKDQYLKLVSRPTLASGGIGVGKFEVEFSEHWEGYTDYFIIIAREDDAPDAEPRAYSMDENNSCTFPADEMARPGIVKVGLCGKLVTEEQNLIRTTTPVTVRVSEGQIAEVVDPIPTRNIYQYLTKQYEGLDVRVKVLEDLLKEAEGGITVDLTNYYNKQETEKFVEDRIKKGIDEGEFGGPDEIYVGEGDMPEGAVLQFELDGEDIDIPDGGNCQCHDEIYVGDGEMPEDATIQIIVDETDEPEDCGNCVKSVNGKTPDKNGNVVVDVGGGAIPRIEISDSVAALEPNKFYVFPEMSTLTIVFGGTVSNEIVQEYKFRFISGGTATTLILPQTVNGDITINANSVVEVSIIDGYAVSQSWAVS